MVVSWPRSDRVNNIDTYYSRPRYLYQDKRTNVASWRSRVVQRRAAVGSKRQAPEVCHQEARDTNTEGPKIGVGMRTVRRRAIDAPDDVKVLGIQVIDPSGMFGCSLVNEKLA